MVLVPFTVDRTHLSEISYFASYNRFTVGLFFLLLGEDHATSIGTTAWLFIPLCGPEDVWTPAVVATSVYATGAVGSAIARRPWPWLLGGLAANVAYDLNLHLRGVEFIC